MDGVFREKSFIGAVQEADTEIEGDIAIPAIIREHTFDAKTVSGVVFNHDAIDLQQLRWKRSLQGPLDR